MKPEIRILGFDDGPFESKSKGKVPVIGVIGRGGRFIDGVLRTDVEIDGLDATERIAELVNQSRHKRQLRVIMFDGITLGGFNVIDIKELNERIGLPVIVVNRKMPEIKRVKSALKKFEDFEERWRNIENAGKIKACNLRKDRKVYYQAVGLEEEEAEEMIILSCTHSFIPEPLRIAHLIATAVVRGESAGRA